MGELGDLEDPVSVGDYAVVESSRTSNSLGSVEEDISSNFPSPNSNFINSSSVSEESEYVDFFISRFSSDSSFE